MANWKPVEGYEGLYEVSDQGEVRGIDRINSINHRQKGVVLKTTLNKRTKYLYVGLRRGGERKTVPVHRIVAKAFVDNPENKATVNHINEIKTDNRACNLEWLTLTENLNYGTHTERATKNKPNMRGVHHPNYGKRGSKANTHKGRIVGVSKNDPSVTVEFDTAATASRELGISSGQLCDALNGKAKSCGGYYWRRLHE